MNGQKQPHLFWVSTITPAETMDAATWLDTTRELRRLGWQVTLIGRSEDGRSQVRGIDVLCLSNPQIYFLGQFLYHMRVVLLLLRLWRDVDVVMFHQISALWLLPLRLWRLVRGGQRPLFVMDTRDLPDPIAGSWRIWLHLQFYYFSHRLANWLADGHITITERMATLVDSPPQRLLGTWPSGVNVETFATAAKARTWPVGDEPVRLIYIGSLLQKRNPLPLCRAVQRANEAGMAIELWLYGNGAERPALEAFAAQSNGRIRVLPPVPHHQVPQLLAQAHVGVTSLPAADDKKYEASSPVKLFEYMAAGMPILATTNPCHTEVVGTGRYAFWAETPDDDALFVALSDLWQRRDTLPSLGAQSAAAAHKWTWQAAAAKLSRALCRGLGVSDETAVVA